MSRTADSFVLQGTRKWWNNSQPLQLHWKPLSSSPPQAEWKSCLPAIQSAISIKVPQKLMRFYEHESPGWIDSSVALDRHRRIFENIDASLSRWKEMKHLAGNSGRSNSNEMLYILYALVSTWLPWWKLAIIFCVLSSFTFLNSFFSGQSHSG